MEEEKNQNLISLSELTKLTPYSLEYLSLRARQGKLKAVKINNVWHSTKADIKNYLKTQSGIQKAKTPELKEFYKNYEASSLEKISVQLVSSFKKAFRKPAAFGKPGQGAKLRDEVEPRDVWDEILLGQKEVEPLRKGISWQLKPILGGLLASSIATFLIFGNPAATFTKAGEFFKPLAESLEETVSQIGLGLADTSKELAQNLSYLKTSITTITDITGIPRFNISDVLANAAFTLGSIFDKAEESFTQGLEKSGEAFSQVVDSSTNVLNKTGLGLADILKKGASNIASKMGKTLGVGGKTPSVAVEPEKEVEPHPVAPLLLEVRPQLGKEVEEEISTLKSELSQLKSKGISVSAPPASPVAKLTSKNFITQDDLVLALASLAGKGELETQLASLNQKLLSQLSEVKKELLDRAQANFNAVNLTQRINNLGAVSIASPTISSPAISSPNITGNASVESLSVSGNASVSGNLTVGGTQTFSGNQAINGNLTIGDATSTDIIYLNSKFAGSILPTSDNVLDIGGAGQRFQTGYFGTSVVVGGGTSTSSANSLLASAAYTLDSAGILSINTTNNQNIVTGSGNFGIGTTTPNWKLQIAAARPFFTLSDTGAAANLKHWTMSSQGGNLYFATSSDALATSTISALTINSNTNVGISTTSPYAKLSVNGNIAGTYFNADATAATSTFAGNLTVSNNASTTNFYVSGNQYISPLTSGSIVFAGASGLLSQDNSNLYWDDNNNRLGIGTTTPNWLLQAAGTRPFFTLSDTGASANLKHWYLSSQGGNLYMGTTTDSYATTTGYQAFTILNNGNVGVGTSSPSQQLSVANLLYVGGSGTSTIQNNLDILGTLKVGTGSTYLTSTGLNFSTTGTITSGTSGGLTIPYASSTALTVSGTASTTNLYVSGLTNGSVVFAGAGGAVSQDNSNLYWDDSNNRLGIGTTTPNNLLQLANAGTLPQFVMSDTSGGTNLKHMYASSTLGALAFGELNDALSTYTERMRIDASGNLGLGTTSPATNLAVAGNLYLTGNITNMASLTATGTVSFNEAARTSGSSPFFSIVGGSDTGLTASTEAPDIQWNLARTKTHSNGTIALQRDILINAPTHAFTSWGAGLITDLVTLGITGAPLLGTNATNTNAHTLYLGASSLNASTTNSYGLTVNANTGATNNYAAAFLGGNVGIATTSPYATLSVAGRGVFNQDLRFDYFTATSTSATSTIAGGLAIETSGFVYDWQTNNVGIGTAAPTQRLVVAGGNILVGPSDATRYIAFYDTDYRIGASTGLEIYTSASDVIRFIDGSTENMRITGNGNLGIGTTTPNWLLQTAGTRPFFALSDTGAAANLKHWTMSSQGGNLYFATSSDALATSTIPALMVKSDGNLGISTTSPYAKLSVNGLMAAANFNADNASATSTFAGGLVVDTNTLVVDYSTNNVGIGTASPVEKLQVAGAVKVTGAIAADTASAGAMGYQSGGLRFISWGADGNTQGKYSFEGWASDGSPNQTYMTMDTVGYVGIGTSTPNWLLQAAGTRPFFALSDTGAAANLKHWYFSSEGGNLYVGTTTDAYATTTGYQAFTILNNGQMGVGTTSPYANFSVALGASDNTALQVYRSNIVSANYSGYVARIESAGTSNFNNALYLKGGAGSAGGYILRADDYSGAGKFVIDGVGNVGIGETAPGSKLAVSGGATIGASYDTTAAPSNGLIVEGNVGIGTTTPNWLLQTAGTRPFFALSDTGAAANLKHWTMSSQGGNLYFATSSDALATSTIPALMVKSDGNLGISTTSPYAKLSVNGLIAAANFNADNASATSTLAGGLVVDTNSLVVDYSTNNVGIGTSSPDSVLTVRNAGGNEEIAFFKQANAGLSTLLTLDGPSDSDTRQVAYQIKRAGILKWYFGQIYNVDGFHIGTSGLTADQKLTIQTGGNVGIGTTTPNWLLQAAGTRPFFALSDTGAGANLKHWYFSSEGGNLYVGTTTDAYATTTGYQAFTILQNGKVGIGTSSPASALSIEGTCIDTGTGCADIAELYPASEEVEPGDIVAVDYEKPGYVRKAKSEIRNPKPETNSNDQNSNDPNTTTNTTTSTTDITSPAVIGIVSTNPAIVIEGSALQMMTGSQYSGNSRKPAIALAGKVPVKVNLEGGEIAVGDRIDLSSIPGVGKKATSSGVTVGIALEAFDGTPHQSSANTSDGTGSSISQSQQAASEIGKILVFVNLGYSRLDSAIAGGEVSGDESAFWGIDESSGAIKFINGLDLNDFGLVNVKAIRGSAEMWSIDSNGKLIAQEVETEKLKVKSEATFGSAEKRIGITIYDEETGQPYCIKVKNGAMVSVAGECGGETPSVAVPPLDGTSLAPPSAGREEPAAEPEPEPAAPEGGEPSPEDSGLEPVVEEPVAEPTATSTEPLATVTSSQ